MTLALLGKYTIIGVVSVVGLWYACRLAGRAVAKSWLEVVKKQKENADEHE